MSSFFQLIPQDPNTLLNEPKRRVQYCRLLRGIAEQASEAIQYFFFEKSYADNFDPIAGDTLCQLRAGMLLHTISWSAQFTNSDHHALIINLQNLVENLAFVETSLTLTTKVRRSRQIKHIQNRETLQGFVEKQPQDFQLPNELVLITRMHLLCKYKKSFNRDSLKQYIDDNQVSRDFGISRSAAKRLIRYWQHGLCQDSYLFVKDVFKCGVIQNLTQRDSDGRILLPAYYVSSMLVNYLKLRRTPLLMIVTDKMGKKYSYRYRLCQKSSEYKLTKTISSLEPHFILQANTYCDLNQISANVNNYLKREGVVSLMLASVANHPQYGCLNNQDFLSISSHEQLTDDEDLRLLHDSMQQSIAHAHRHKIELGPAGLIYITHMFSASTAEVLCGIEYIDAAYLTDKPQPHELSGVYRPAFVY